MLSYSLNVLRSTPITINMHLIVGDFNLPYINWDVSIGPDDDIYKVVLDFFSQKWLQSARAFPNTRPQPTLFVVNGC